MIVITLTNCPSALRGDLTKWLFEIDTNVFVGRVSARVRDQLWKRIEDHCDRGRASMVFNTNNEQHFDFKVHNSAWEPVDIDGFKLMLRPNTNIISTSKVRAGYSKASRYLEAKRSGRAKICSSNGRISVATDNEPSEQYAVIDIETTGLSFIDDKIIRLNALRVSNNEITDSISISIQPEDPTAPKQELSETRGTASKEHGERLPAALEKFLSFIGSDTIVLHNIRFCMRFINSACNSCNFAVPANNAQDVLAIAKNKLYNLRSHSLDEIAKHFEIIFDRHDGLERCNVIMKIYEKFLAIDRNTCDDTKTIMNNL